MYLSGRDEGGGVDGRVSVCRHVGWPARHCYEGNSLSVSLSLSLSLSISLSLTLSLSLSLLTVNGTFKKKKKKLCLSPYNYFSLTLCL